MKTLTENYPPELFVLGLKKKEATTNHSPFSRESFAFSNHKSFFHLRAFDDSMGHEDTMVKKEIFEYISNTLKLCGFKMYLQT